MNARCVTVKLMRILYIVFACALLSSVVLSYMLFIVKIMLSIINTKKKRYINDQSIEDRQNVGDTNQTSYICYILLE